MERVQRININPQPWYELGENILEKQHERRDREALWRSIKEYIDKQDTILDVGVGAGREIRAMREDGYDNKIDVADYFKDVFDFLKTKSLDITNYFQVDLREDFKFNKYDVVFALEVIEHMDEPFKLISKLKKFANKCVIITCPLGEPGNFLQHVWKFGLEDFEDTESKEINIDGVPHILAVYYV